MDILKCTITELFPTFCHHKRCGSDCLCTMSLLTHAYLHLQDKFQEMVLQGITRLERPPALPFHEEPIPVLCPFFYGAPDRKLLEFSMLGVLPFAWYVLQMFSQFVASLQCLLVLFVGWVCCAETFTSTNSKCITLHVMAPGICLSATKAFFYYKALKKLTHIFF